MTTNNNNLGARYYTKEFRDILEAVFSVKKAFANALAPLQVVDGIQNNEHAFYVKTSATPVVVGDYKKGTNDVMGDGTGINNRFGNITEVIYTDTPVPYAYDYAIHEGIDRHTVNNDEEAVVADRLALQAEALVRKANDRVGKYLSSIAGKTLTLEANNSENVRKLFKEVEKYLTDLEVSASVTVYVRPEIFAIYKELINTTSSTGFSTDLNVEKESSKYFASTDMAYIVADKTTVPFIGIETARTIESTLFDGKQIQGAAKGGEFTLDDNKKAIIKVTGTPGL